MHGDGSIEAVTIENTGTGELERYDCEALITLLGFVSHLGAIAEWGIELEGKRQIKIDPTTCETSMPGVYAAGDVAGYPGKITLITVGMGEAAIAANNAIAAIRGEKVQPEVLHGLARTRRETSLRRASLIRGIRACPQLCARRFLASQWDA